MRLPNMVRFTRSMLPSACDKRRPDCSEQNGPQSEAVHDFAIAVVLYFAGAVSLLSVARYASLACVA